MEALRVAVLPKDELLASIGASFHPEWDCFGVPDCLYCDNGPEFRSTSMKATEAVLGMRIVDVEPGRPDLKGKIERWLRTLNRDGALATGNDLSNPLDRLHYDSAGKAILTLADVKWIIARWIVDIYNQKPHSVTGEVPAERWERRDGRIRRETAAAERTHRLACGYGCHSEIASGRRALQRASLN